jgi:L-2-hydroxyglutarate oxidase LhgO
MTRPADWTPDTTPADDAADAVVIGAGVVGLACARALARAGREVWVLEAAAGIGSGVSSRSSEVIHAGLYYPTGSLKARHCVRGKELLYAYCAEHGVPHARLGKLVVATRDEQVAQLEAIRHQAQANGVHDLQWLDGAEAQAREPSLRAVRALWSPSSGIVDSHALMLALQADLEARGGQVVTRTRVVGLAAAPGGGFTVHTQPSDAAAQAEPWTLHARTVVNAAGLHAVALANRTEGAAPRPRPVAHYARGRYFALGRRAPFRHLVYPVPEPGGLGVHLTLDLGGQARFGPDVQWMPEARDAPPEAIDRFDYTVDASLRARFAAEVRAYWPDLPADALQPAYAGIRPKLSGPGEPAADFRLSGPDEHGRPGLVHLLGIESPGLTSALSLAEDVAARLA